MKKNIKKGLVIGSSILSVLFFLGSFKVHAEEGMFYKDQIPFKKINKTYAVDLTKEKVNKISKAVLKVSIGGGGGSGSFISPDGLVLTNHHVAYDCVQDLRKKGKISAKKGGFASDYFYAKTYTEELPCSTYELHVTKEIIDITDQVVPALPKTGGLKEKNKVLEEISKKLISICEGISTKLSYEAYAKKQALDAIVYFP